MEEKAPFGVKEALLCAVLSAALVTGATAMYLVWSTKMKRDSDEVEGASDMKKELLPPLTMDQLPEGLEYMEFCKMNLIYHERAVMAERVANCFEENRDLEKARIHYLISVETYLQVEQNQRAYALALHCRSLTRDSSALYQCEWMCAIASIFQHSPKALEHFNRCEELALSMETPKVNLAVIKRENNPARTPSKD